MGALAIGYLAGSGGRESRVEGATPIHEPPAASSPAAIPPPIAPADLPPVVDPPAPSIPRQLTDDDGLAPYPPFNGVDLDCDEIRRPVRVPGPDPHRLDHDGNGVGCESY